MASCTFPLHHVPHGNVRRIQQYKLIFSGPLFQDRKEHVIVRIAQFRG